MTGKEQLRILAYTLPKLVDNLAKKPNVRHYKASAANDLDRPTLRPIAI